MRKLSVKRKWSIIECGSRVRLYVQSTKEASTHSIGDKYFREYKLKNGRTVTVDILDDETVVYVDTSTMNAEYTVPAGSEDVRLLTKPKYNPLQGNPFSITKI